MDLSTRLFYATKVQNEISSIYTTQTGGKETNLLVRSESCESSIQGKLPSCMAAGASGGTPHGCGAHIKRQCSSNYELASGCSTQTGTMGLTSPSFPGWDATRCKALHERRRWSFSGPKSPMAPFPLPGALVGLLFLDYRTEPSTTPDRIAH